MSSRILFLEDLRAQAVAEMLNMNSKVKTINLEGNAIGDAGAVALAEAMNTKKTLPKIYLRQNIIGEAGNEAQQVSPASEA